MHADVFVLHSAWQILSALGHWRQVFGARAREVGLGLELVNGLVEDVLRSLLGVDHVSLHVSEIICTILVILN